ncbi:MAG: DNA-binding transcriptional regulator OxyR [Bdellovibrio sp.]|nr:MAG: DNA-binding transcriptional regulator OxyR [Bdellovibrio sp.]
MQAITMPTLTQLEYLVAVERLRHFGKAAKACHVSQPTLSMQLRKLEEEYGILFFDRSKQPILPTSEGLGIIEQAKAVLREMGKLDHLGKNRKLEPVGEFKLALIPTVAPYLLPLFLEPFAKRYPEIKLFIEELTTQNILDALENDQVDAGILVTPLKGENFLEIPLYYEPFWLLVNEKHPLAKLSAVHEEKLDNKDVWLLSEGHCLRNQIVRICSLRGKPGIFPNVHLESGSLETIIHLVEQGHGYTLLPHLATKTERLSRGTLLKPFSKPVPSREVSLVYRRTQYKQPILNALASEVRKCLPKDLPQEKSKAIEVVKV